MGTNSQLGAGGGRRGRRSLREIAREGYETSDRIFSCLYVFCFFPAAGQAADGLAKDREGHLISQGEPGHVGTVQRVPGSPVLFPG